MLVRRTSRAPLVTATLTAVVLVLAGCDSGSDADPDGGSAKSGGPAVIAPENPVRRLKPSRRKKSRSGERKTTLRIRLTTTTCA